MRVISVINLLQYLTMYTTYQGANYILDELPIHGQLYVNKVATRRKNNIIINYLISNHALKLQSL